MPRLQETVDRNPPCTARSGPGIGVVVVVAVALIALVLPVVAPMIVRVSPGVVRPRSVTKINSIGELAALARVPRLITLAPEAPLSLELPELTQAEAQVFEVRLNREWTACGCGTGQAGVGLGLAAYAAAVLLDVASAIDSVWGHVGWALAMALVGAAVGKVVGRFRSLLRFRRLAGEVRALTERRARPPYSRGHTKTAGATAR